MIAARVDFIKHSNYYLIMKYENPSSNVLQQQLALIGHALASAQRLRILTLLAQSTKTVEELGAELDESLANTSAHLKVLRGACLVERRKEGRFAHYELASPSVEGLLLVLDAVARERLPELREVVREFNDDPSELIELPPDELLAGVKGGRLSLIDVRPESEFAAGHLPGARSCPLDILRQKLPKLRGTVVVYCRGPYCLGAKEAVALLRKAGLRAKRLALGVMEWRELGQEIVTETKEAHQGAAHDTQ
jgi:rhodanese-related sulfurtransferase/DNA-binding transcriptional ArsR family regulator